MSVAGAVMRAVAEPGPVMAQGAARQAAVTIEIGRWVYFMPKTSISTTVKAVGAERTAGRAEVAAVVVQVVGQAGADLLTNPRVNRDYRLKLGCIGAG